MYWMHWNLLSGCRINKYVIGLYYSTTNQWRRKFHVSAVNKIYEDWNRLHSTLVARCTWIMLCCAMCTKTFWTIFISRNRCRNSFWENTVVSHCLGNILILCWICRTFCISGLMQWRSQECELGGLPSLAPFLSFPSPLPSRSPF